MKDEIYDLTCPSTFQCWICDTINLRQPILRKYEDTILPDQTKATIWDPIRK